MLQLRLIKHTCEVNPPCGPAYPVINTVRSGKAAPAVRVQKRRVHGMRMENASALYRPFSIRQFRPAGFHGTSPARIVTSGRL